MGKRIIQRARGHGSIRYRSTKQAYAISAIYPEIGLEGKGIVEKLINVICYSAPVAKIKINNKVFFNIASTNIFEGQEIEIGKNAQIKDGNILPLSSIPPGTSVYNIETFPGSSGKLVRTSGLSAKITKKDDKRITIALPSKQEKTFDPKCRATIGTIAAGTRTEKPILKAGKMYFMKKARGARVWPRTSAVKVNAIDHPFGCGRGKRIKSKIAKRNAPPGANVGLLRPRRTGRKR
ncbi:MAG: 50S ribosomal protein L2 [Candidatus Pacearchaeota archaeon]|nr:50S ribosomal protein L2 [Candidatus Pacearchaeota archaeon]